MTDAPFLTACFLCQLDKKCGPNVYEGRNVSAWEVWICNACRNGNHDGVVPNGPRGKRPIDHLNKKGIPIKLNKNGWIDIPG